jgi:hypothetical protein
MNNLVRIHSYSSNPHSKSGTGCYLEILNLHFRSVLLEQHGKNREIDSWVPCKRAGIVASKVAGKRNTRYREFGCILWRGGLSGSITNNSISLTLGTTSPTTFEIKYTVPNYRSDRSRVSKTCTTTSTTSGFVPDKCISIS